MLEQEQITEHECIILKPVNKEGYKNRTESNERRLQLGPGSIYKWTHEAVRRQRTSLTERAITFSAKSLGRYTQSALPFLKFNKNPKNVQPQNQYHKAFNAKGWAC
jgi:hypothetical protein